MQGDEKLRKLFGLIKTDKTMGPEYKDATYDQFKDLIVKDVDFRKDLHSDLTKLNIIDPERTFDDFSKNVEMNSGIGTAPAPVQTATTPVQTLPKPTQPAQQQQVVTPMKEPQTVKPVEEKKADRFITFEEETAFGLIPFVASAIKSVKGFFGNETGVEKGKKVAVNPSPLKAYEEAQTKYRDADKQYQELEKQSKAAGQGLQYGDYDFGTHSKLSKEIPGLKTNAEKSLLGAGPTIDKIIDDAYKNADQSKFMDYNLSTKKRIVSLDKIQNLSREIAKKSGLPETGYAQQRIASQMKAYVEHKQIEPDVEKEVFSLLGNQTPKNLAQKEFEKVVKENTKIQGLKTQAEIEQKVVADQLNVEQKAITSQYEKDYKTLVADLNKESAADPEIDALRKTIIAEDKQAAKQTHEKYQQLVNSGKMTVVQATAARDKEYELLDDPKKLEEKKERINALAKQKYGAKYANAFQQYTNALNETSTRFNRRYKREATEIVGLANAKINSELEAVKKQYKTNPETVEKIKAAYKEAYGKVLKEKDLKEYAVDQSLGFWNQLANSTISSFGAGVSGYATTFGLGKVAQLGDVISNNFHPSNIAVSTKEDWLDPIKAAHGTGDILGRMVPSIAIGAATAAATQGAGTPLAVRLMLTGFADMMAESADISGTIYKQMLDKTGSAVDAGNAARDAFEGNLYNYPAYVVGSLPFFANALKGVPGLTGVLGRTAFGAGLEMVTETYTESVQGAQEKSILAGERLKDTFKELTIDHILDTGLQMAPIAILGGAPHLFQGGRDIIEKNFADRAVKAFRAKEVLSTELNDENQAQFFAQIHNEKGAAFAKSMLGSLFIDGKITPEQNERLSTFINNYDTWSPQAKKLGFNGIGAKIGGILFNDLEQARASTDSQLIKEAQSAFDSFLKTGNAELISVGLSDGSTYFYKPGEFSRMLDTPDFQKLIQDGSVQLSGMSSNMGTGEYKSLIEKVDMIGKAAKPAASVVEYVTVTDDELNAFKQGQVDPERLAGVQEDADAVRNGEITLEDLPDDPNYRTMVQMQLDASKPVQTPVTTTGLQTGNQVVKPEPIKLQVMGREVNMYNDYIPSKAEDVEPDAVYSFNANSKDGIPPLLRNKAYANPREVNGVKSENWHASISGDDLLKLYTNQQANGNTNAGTSQSVVDEGVGQRTGSENVVTDAGVVPAPIEGGAAATTEAQPAAVPLPQVGQTQQAEVAPLNIDFQKNEGRNVNYQGITGRVKIDSDGAPYVFTKDGEVVYIEGGLSGQTPQQLGLQPLADDVVNEADIETVLQDENAPLDQGQLEYDFENNTLTLYGRPFSYDGIETNNKGQTTALRLIDQNGKIKFIRNQDVILEFEIQKEIYEKQPTEKTINAAATELQVKPIERSESSPATVQQTGPVADTEVATEEVVEPTAKPASLAGTTFKTAKGSVYTVGENGVTTRNKSFHPEHGGDEGIKPTSQKTYYVTKEDLDKLALVQTQGWQEGVRPVIGEMPNGNIGVGIIGGKYNGLIAKGTEITPRLNPEVGLYPVEIWNNGEGHHFGNEIIEVSNAPTAKPASLANQIADLRAKEQAEYDAMPDPKDKAKRKEIYDRYDKPISDLLAQQKKEEAPAPKAKPNPFIEKTRKAFNAALKKLGLKAKVKFISDEEAAEIVASGEPVKAMTAGFQTRDGKPIGFAYDTDQVARGRFDFSKLKKIGSGSDRDVYDLGDGKVLKVAKTARGLTQNIYEGDFFLEGIIPEVFERGLNYVIAENVKAATSMASTASDFKAVKRGNSFVIVGVDNNYEYGVRHKTIESANAAIEKLGDAYAVEIENKKANKALNEMLAELSKFTQKDFDNKKSELQDVLEKYELTDIMSYDVLWGDFTAKRNWGIKDGQPIHLDGGTFGGVDMIDSYKNKTNLSDPEFRKIYEESKRLKKQFGDTDKNTMYMREPSEPSGIPLTETDLLVAAKPKDILENLNRYSLEQMVQLLKQNDPNGAYQDFLDEDEFSYDEGLQAARENIERMFEDYDPLDMQQKLKWMDLTYKKKSPFAPSKFAENNESEEGGKVVPLFMKDSKGTILGFVQPQPDGSFKVWIDPATTNAETPIHELAGHIFMPLLKEAAPELHAKGVELIQNTSYMDNAKALGLEGAAASEEALAQAIGEKGKQLTESKRKDFLDWLNGMWKKIGEKLGITKPIKDLTLEEFTDLIAGSIVFGKEFEMKGEAGRDARADLKDNVGPEEFKRMEDIHRNGEKMLKEMQSKGLIKIECP